MKKPYVLYIIICMVIVMAVWLLPERKVAEKAETQKETQVQTEMLPTSPLLDVLPEKSESDVVKQSEFVVIQEDIPETWQRETSLKDTYTLDDIVIKPQFKGRKGLPTQMSKGQVRAMEEQIIAYLIEKKMNADTTTYQKEVEQTEDGWLIYADANMKLENLVVRMTIRTDEEFKTFTVGVVE